MIYVIRLINLMEIHSVDIADGVLDNDHLYLAIKRDTVEFW